MAIQYPEDGDNRASFCWLLCFFEITASAEGRHSQPGELDHHTDQYSNMQNEWKKLKNG